MTTFVCYTELISIRKKSFHTQTQDKSNVCNSFHIQPIISKTLFTQYRKLGSVKDHGQKSLKTYWLTIKWKQWIHSQISA